MKFKVSWGILACLILFRKLEEKQAKLERQLEVEKKKLDEEQRKLDDERKALEVERTRVAQEVLFQHLFHEIILLSLKKTSINISFRRMTGPKPLLPLSNCRGWRKT